MIKNAPTPVATANINTIFGMEGTCCASTCKSGSEMVMMKPIIKLITIITGSFLERVIIVPTLSPMGVMDISTPTLKSSIPTVKRTAPIKNVIKILGGIGAIEKHKSKTIASMGKTAFKVSNNFSLNFERLNCNTIRRLS